MTTTTPEQSAETAGGAAATPNITWEDLRQWEIDAIMLLSKDPMVGLGRLLRGSETLRDWARSLLPAFAGDKDRISDEMQSRASQVAHAVSVALPVVEQAGEPGSGHAFSDTAVKAFASANRAQDDLVSALAACNEHGTVLPNDTFSLVCDAKVIFHEKLGRFETIREFKRFGLIEWTERSPRQPDRPEQAPCLAPATPMQTGRSDRQTPEQTERSDRQTPKQAPCSALLGPAFAERAGSTLAESSIKSLDKSQKRLLRSLSRRKPDKIEAAVDKAAKARADAQEALYFLAVTKVGGPFSPIRSKLLNAISDFDSQTGEALRYDYYYYRGLPECWWKARMGEIEKRGSGES